MSGTFDNIDATSITHFQLEMLEDYDEQVEHPEGVQIGEIIESQLEVGGEPAPLVTADVTVALLSTGFYDPDDEVVCVHCGAPHGGICPAEEDWLAFSEACL